VKEATENEVLTEELKIHFSKPIRYKNSFRMFAFFFEVYVEAVCDRFPVGDHRFSEQ
jgi:hypothetical protein